MSATTTCPSCGEESEKCYRCTECGRDLADTGRSAGGGASVF